MRKVPLSDPTAQPSVAADLNEIRQNDRVERWLPKASRPYVRLARLDRPVGTWLTLLPCLSALVQAADGSPSSRRVIVFSVGALIMRSAGSTINDIADRDFDSKVERTRFRPRNRGYWSKTGSVVSRDRASSCRSPVAAPGNDHSGPRFRMMRASVSSPRPCFSAATANLRLLSSMG